MSINTKLVIQGTEGDNVVEHIKTTVRADFDYFLKLSMPLTASVSANVDIPFTTVEFLYLEVETSGATIQFYKDGEVTYEAVSQQLLLNGVEITQIDLLSATAADVFLYLGGS
jgi:hypothetical protein